MNLNKFTLAAATSTALLLVSCQDYELDSTAIASFKQAYDENFVNQVGSISPEQSWDFSTVGGHRGQGELTRAVTLSDGWYYPQEQTLTWMKNQLKENTDNSSKCQDFFLSWTPGMSFQIVPIYEGKATMDWDLYMKVSSASGSVLYNKKIWSKGENVQIVCPTLWQFSDTEVCIWYETTSSSVKIWPWRENGTTGEEYTGGAYGYKDMTYVGKHGEKNVFKWTSPFDANSSKGVPTKVTFMPNGSSEQEITFRNHGYVYQDNPTYTGHDGGNSGSQISRYDGSWRDFTGEDDAALASDFRAKPIAISELSNNTWPLGSIVSFYLKITDNHGLEGCAETNEIMSTLNHQIVYLNVPTASMPTNVDTGDRVVTGILGCEDSSRNGYYFDRQGEGETKNHPRSKGASTDNLISYWGKSDWDYNDVVFLINGVMPAPVIIDQNPSVSTFAEKRYMAEDLTNTGDMDFNDIVVDVKDTRVTYWTVSDMNEKVVDTSINGEKTIEIDGVETKVTFTNGIGDYQTATVRHLCGTVPVRFKVGETLLGWITNPVDANQSVMQLQGTYSDQDTYGTGSETTSGNNPDVTSVVTGWNAETNNVAVFVGWDGVNQEATKPSVNSDSDLYSGSNWTASFPERGTVPCIIATDVTDMWTPECVDITVTDWWKSNFITTGSSK